MSSLLRTLSLYHDRPYQNGGNQFSVNSPSHRALSNAKSSSPLSPFFPGVLSQKSSRKGMSSWKKWFFRCLIFFSLGFLLGMAPFGGYEDVKRRDFSFEENTMAKSAENDEGDVRNLLVVEAKGGEGLVVDKVELRVVEEKEVKERFDFVPRKQLIVVTPTYNRALQAYYLNRLGQVLRLVPPPLLWIVVEMNVASSETADILRKTGVMYRHLVTTKNLTDVKDKSVHQRNTALEHIENHKLDGVVYFADDDSIHSLELFESLREIRRFGTWPVAMLAQTWNKVELEGPVCNGSQVIGWHTNKNKVLRRFHIDMSGFAFNSTILWDPKRWQRPTSGPIRQLDTVKEGFHVWIMSLQYKLSIYVWDPYFVELMGSQNQSRWTRLSFHCVSLQGTTFIEQVVEDESQMEGLPLGCSKILNWHLKLEARELFNPKASLLQKNLDA